MFRTKIDQDSNIQEIVFTKSNTNYFGIVIIIENIKFRNYSQNRNYYFLENNKLQNSWSFIIKNKY